jgi:hypothetical protein
MKVFYVCGTWQSGLRIFKEINELLPEIESTLIPSPAKYGDGMSYRQSVNITGGNIFEHCFLEEEPYVIVAYSQGAHAAGDYVHNFPDENCKALFNVADPMRHSADIQVGHRVEGSGIMGERQIGHKARQIVAPGDFVAANTNPFISNVAKYTIDMSINDPITWAKSIPDAMKSHKSGGNWPKAAKDLASYLRTGVHVNYHDYEVYPRVKVPAYIAREIRNLDGK